jgi:hypothetical protein
MKLSDKLAQRRKDMAQRSQGGAFLTFKEGITRIRILPVGDEVDWAVEVVYFYLGEKHKGYISPKTFGKKCPVMDAYNELSSSKDEADRALAAKFRPKKKYFVPVAKYKDEKGTEVEDTGAKLALLPDSAYQMALDLYLDAEEAGDFTDVEKGYDLKIKRTGKGMQDTEYSVIKCKETALPKKFKLLFKKDPSAFNPETLVKALIPSKEEAERIIGEYLSLPAEDDSEAKPKKKKKKKRDL